MRHFNQVTADYKTTRHATTEQAYSDLIQELSLGFGCGDCLKRLIHLFSTRWNWSELATRQFIEYCLADSAPRNYTLEGAIADKNLTQDLAAEQAGISQPTISRMIRREKVGKGAIAAISKVLGRTPTELDLR